jgi:hypothetical protein
MQISDIRFSLFRQVGNGLPIFINQTWGIISERLFSLLFPCVPKFLISQQSCDTETVQILPPQLRHVYECDYRRGLDWF